MPRDWDTWRLAVRDGGDICSLAPLRPEIAFLYAPGGPLLYASLSALLPGLALSDVMMGSTFAIALLFVALAGSLGEELYRGYAPRSGAAGEALSPVAWRRLAQLGAAASPGLWTALFDSHFTAILGLTIGLAALIACSRAWRTNSWSDVAIAGVMVAALALAHQDVALAVAVGLVLLAIAQWVAAGPGRRVRFAVATASMVAIAVVLLAPWLLTIAPLLATGISSPFQPAAGHWRQLVLYQGVFLPLVALAGVAVGIRQRPAWTLGMLAWIVLLVDLSITSVFAGMAPRLMAPLLRFAYPFSLAWHGPVLPFLALGTVALAAASKRWGWRPEVFPGSAVGLALGALLGIGFVAAQSMAGLFAQKAPVHGALSSQNDVEAMRWIRRTAPPAARVLNYPGDLPGRRDWEAHWAPVLTERDCVYFRMQPFFLDEPRADRSGALAATVREQRRMLGFWRDPARAGHATMLAAAGIRYVLVPEAIADPSSLERAWRGRPPALLDGRPRPALDVGWLRPVFSAGGATVYELDSRYHE